MGALMASTANANLENQQKVVTAPQEYNSRSVSPTGPCDGCALAAGGRARTRTKTKATGRRWRIDRCGHAHLVGCVWLRDMSSMRGSGAGYGQRGVQQRPESHILLHAFGRASVPATCGSWCSTLQVASRKSQIMAPRSSSSDGWELQVIAAAQGWASNNNAQQIVHPALPSKEAAGQSGGGRTAWQRGSLVEHLRRGWTGHSHSRHLHAWASKSLYRSPKLVPARTKRSLGRPSPGPHCASLPSGANLAVSLGSTSSALSALLPHPPSSHTVESAIFSAVSCLISLLRGVVWIPSASSLTPVSLSFFGAYAFRTIFISSWRAPAAQLVCTRITNRLIAHTQLGSPSACCPSAHPPLTSSACVDLLANAAAPSPAESQSHVARRALAARCERASPPVVTAACDASL